MKLLETPEGQAAAIQLVGAISTLFVGIGAVLRNLEKNNLRKKGKLRDRKKKLVNL